MATTDFYRGAAAAALFLLGAGTLYAARRTGCGIDRSTVPGFDLHRMMGLWYEIARFDHRFERGLSHVTAVYTLERDGTVRVRNQGLKGDELTYHASRATARMPDSRHPGHLRVSFFPLFWSDYNVLEVDDDYSCMLIGSRSDRYLWILCRQPVMPVGSLRKLLTRALGRGYDIRRLVWVDQG